MSCASEGRRNKAASRRGLVGFFRAREEDAEQVKPGLHVKIIPLVKRCEGENYISSGGSAEGHEERTRQKYIDSADVHRNGGGTADELDKRGNVPQRCATHGLEFERKDFDAG